MPPQMGGGVGRLLGTTHTQNQGSRAFSNHRGQFGWKADATFHFLPAFNGHVLESCDKESYRGSADVPACKYLPKRRVILLSVHSANSANQLGLGPFLPQKARP